MHSLSYVSAQEAKTLDERHREELRLSGLSEATIEESGIYSADPATVKKLLGFNPMRCRGMVIPYAGEDWAPRPIVRIKLDEPGADGKRYRTAANSAPELYVPPILDAWVLADPSKLLLITEGEKKALKACQEGLPCVALGGVWAWRMRRTDGESVPIPRLNHVVWHGRRVYVVFDSDLVRNPDVARAETELAKELARRGATVYGVRLPGGTESIKVGLDDYLLVHRIEEFQALEPVRLAPKVMGGAWSVLT